MVLEEGAGAAIAEIIDLCLRVGFMELADKRRRKKHIPDPERIDDQERTAHF